MCVPILRWHYKKRCQHFFKMIMLLPPHFQVNFISHACAFLPSDQPCIKAVRWRSAWFEVRQVVDGAVLHVEWLEFYCHFSAVFSPIPHQWNIWFYTVSNLMTSGHADMCPKQNEPNIFFVFETAFFVNYLLNMLMRLDCCSSKRTSIHSQYLRCQLVVFIRFETVSPWTVESPYKTCVDQCCKIIVCVCT